MARQGCGAVLVLSAVTLAMACDTRTDKPSGAGEAGVSDARQLVDARGVVDGVGRDAAVRCDPARQPDADCAYGTPQWSCVPDEQGGLWTFSCPLLMPDANLRDTPQAGDGDASEGGVSPVDARGDGGASDVAARCEPSRRREVACSYGSPSWTCVPDESGGVWSYTCPPMPVDGRPMDASAEDAAAADGAGECTKDGDCRLEAFYCTGCDCLALAPGAKVPMCSGPGVSCWVNPCNVMVVRCQSQRCVAKTK